MSVFHVAVFTWKEGTSVDHVADFMNALTELRSQLPMLISYDFGSDLGLRDGNGEFAVVAQMATAEDVIAYLDHPLHQELVKTYVLPHAAERRAVQFTR